jgi:hypothetical protein
MNNNGRIILDGPNFKENVGRVDLDGPNFKDQLQMFDKIPIKTNSFHDAMKGNIYDTTLSDLFFSRENQEIIQNGIRAGVHEKSNGKFIIGIQSYESIQVIMRSIFLQHSKNLPTNVTEQISELNQIVLKHCIDKVFGEARGYIHYKKDISTLVTPLDHPTLPREDFKDLEFKNWF